MKKSLIALAVAGAMTAPIMAQADATLYGSLRTKVQLMDGQELNVTDNSTRIGVKGSSELFSGAKAFAHFEQAASTTTGGFTGGRLAYVGAEGDFGKVQIGRMWTAHTVWTGFTTDIVDNSTSGATVYDTLQHRLSNMIAYYSPDMGGMKLAASVLGANDNNGEDLDAFSLSAQYKMGGLVLAASIIDTQGAGAGTGTNSALSAAYTMDAFYIGARFRAAETLGSGKEDAFEVAGTYSMGNTTLLANFATDDNDADDSMSLEVQQKLGKKARVFAAVLDNAGTTGVEAGYRVDF